MHRFSSSRLPGVREGEGAISPTLHLALPGCRPWQWLVQRFSGRLHGEDSSEFAFVYPKDILEGTPSSTEEDGIEFAVVLKEDPQALGDSKDRVDCVAMGDILNYFTVDVFCELYSALSAA
jgi:hypothetical protein